MDKKPKIAIISLTSCEGCQFVILDLGKKFFNFLKKVDLVDFKLIEDAPFPKGAKIDVAFVEGNPIRKEEVAVLKEVRKRAKFLVVIGNCASLGGIPELKNYQNKEKTIRYIYKNIEGIENPEIKEIDNFVKVDFTIRGCPINGEEFLKFANSLIKGKIPKFIQKPVCTECDYMGKDTCFLRRKEPCLGPISVAGCTAICPRGEFPCYGCRDIIETIQPKGFLKSLEKMKSKQDIEENLELFGIKDGIEEKYKNKNNK
ncbi:MAG: hypothetical protein ABH956_01625 [Candidatus Nealsonbacteria bacterium]